jgi:branched-chain amino acid aminotransferase
MNYPISITRTSKSRLQNIDFNSIPFGKYYSDHMFIANYSGGKWQNSRIVPFDNISLSPATFSLHYGQLIFEGMKAYKDQDGTPQLFRPEQNYERFNKSAVRMGMPEVPAELFLDAIKQLVQIDKDWIPTNEGSSLYVRPFMMAMDKHIGVKPTTEFQFMIITSPCGPYFDKPVKVLVADKYVRAFPGGTGFAKAAGNYGGVMLPLKEAQEQGFDQVLWLDGQDFDTIEEAGTMNVFFAINNVVYTPELDGCILDGVTRSSIIELLRSLGYDVREQKVSIKEIITAAQNGTLTDAFGAGTAVLVIPIGTLGYKGKLYQLAPVAKRVISPLVKKELWNIMVSRSADKFGWITKLQTPVKV